MQKQLNWHGTVGIFKNCTGRNGLLLYLLSDEAKEEELRHEL